MATHVETAPARSRAMESAALAPPKVIPVNYWAFAGAVISAFMLYVIVRWVTGPYFERVDPGPTPIPGWMKASLIAWQVIMPAIWLYMVYRFIVKPWRLERRLTVDGLFLIAGTTCVFQDGMSNYFNHWITYNSHLVNWGSWYNDVPGWMAFGEPGRMFVEPPLFIPFAHGFAWLTFAIIGSKVIRRCRARWPSIGLPHLIVITYALTFVMDAVLEGIVWMPFGVFMYPGGKWPLFFADAYHKFPAVEAIFVAAWSTPVVLLYHFRNDKGETLVERGVSDLRAGPGKKNLYRVLAMVGAFQIGLLIFYTVPQTSLFASKSTEWPADLVERSYMTDGLCGVGTDLACPGPGVPLYRGDGRKQVSARIGPDGKVTIPEGGGLPEPVPIKAEPEGPFDGGLF